MERLSTNQTLAMLGLTHRNSLRSRPLTPIKDKGRNYYLRSDVEALVNPKPVFTTPSKTMMETGVPEGGWPD